MARNVLRWFEPWNGVFPNVVPGSYTARAERPPRWVRSVATTRRVLEDFDNGRLGAYRAVSATALKVALPVPRPGFPPGAILCPRRPPRSSPGSHRRPYARRAL